MLRQVRISEDVLQQFIDRGGVVAVMPDEHSDEQALIEARKRTSTRAA
jgi:hypothetical protein